MSEEGISYERTPGLQIQGELVESIGTVDLRKEPSLFPFLRFLKSSLPVFSVVYLDPQTIKAKPDEERSKLYLHKPSMHHGRSYETTFGEQAGKIVWADENGIVFGAINTKGNNLEDLHIDRDIYTSEDYIIWGLQTGKCLERLIRASQVMRREGIETEKPEMIIKPKELVIDGEKVTVDEFKEKLLEKVKEEVKSGRRRMSVFIDPITEADLPKIEALINESELYFTVRGLQVTERLRDLDEAKTKKEFQEIMARVFRFVNLRNRIEADRAKTQVPDKLDPESEEDIEYYFTKYLPERIALNLARFHKGLKHGFLSDQNVSLVGSLYDLDSVSGVALGLGDREIGIKDYGEDIQEFLSKMLRIFYSVPDERQGSVQSSWFKIHWSKKVRKKFFKRFLAVYLENFNFEKYLNLEREHLIQEMLPGEKSMKDWRRKLNPLAELKKMIDKGGKDFFQKDLRRNIEWQTRTVLRGLISIETPTGTERSAFEELETIVKEKIQERQAQILESVLEISEEELRSRYFARAKELLSLKSRLSRGIERVFMVK